MQRSTGIGGAFLGAVLLIAIAACSGHAPGGSALPPAGQEMLRNPAPNTSPTPPVTAPVTIPYPYTNEWTTKTWAGPTSPPTVQKGSDSGVTTVKFALDKKTGIYDVVELIKSKSGSFENLNSAIGFLRHHGGIAQIILSDNYTYTAGSFSETGMDTYPNGQNSFDFPLTTGNRWSAAAGHSSYVNIHQSGKNAFAENTAYTEAADGTYRSQTSFSNIHGNQNQNNYASTTHVLLNKASDYTLSERAAGYNKLTQLFELPKNGDIAVRSEGKEPLPFKRGTVKVPDWYPGDGSLPGTLYSDQFHVVGTEYAPSPQCGSREGQLATEVVEKFANLDPVQGFYNTYTAWYYLMPLAKGQYWFGCIIEKYANRTYANGWAMSAGSWGKLSSEQIGTEILIASKVKSQALFGGLSLPALTFPPIAFRPMSLR
ncbi:MAG: hypothetical protein JO113_09115 [Candidatus Eremiobacteraeota bacterium]|nr:hypothetical protein [Candidatus Eremiobacteraeota bacterium]